MRLTVLMNAGPWLPVPPKGYGGIENVVATLVPELRRRGVRVLLASVGTSSLPADELIWCFRQGQFERLAAPYAQVVGVTHAHMQHLVQVLRTRREVDLVHDHLEVVGAATLAALGQDGPPALQTLHWDLRKHPEFYGSFDGGGRVFFNGVSRQQLGDAPPRLREQVLGAVDLAVPLERYPFRAGKEGWFLALGRITPAKGQDVAARTCKELGERLVIAGPVAGIPDPAALAARLAHPGSPHHTYQDVRFYLDAVRPFEDGERIRWVGTVRGGEKLELLSRAKALLMPLRWSEPGGTAAIEALACGTPVVALRRGALAGIVEHGVTGFLADDEQELAEYLRCVDGIDPAACRRAAEERFSAPVMADRYLELYREVLSRAGRAPA